MAKAMRREPVTQNSETLYSIWIGVREYRLRFKCQRDANTWAMKQAVSLSALDEAVTVTPIAGRNAA